MKSRRSQLYDEFCSALDCRPAYEALLQAGSDMFGLQVDIVPIVAQLTAANIRIGILSNTSLPHWEFLTRGQYRILQDYFDVFALSFQIGAMKPARKSTKSQPTWQGPNQNEFSSPTTARKTWREPARPAGPPPSTTRQPSWRLGCASGG